MKKAPNPRIFLVLTFASLLGGTGMVYMQFSSLDGERDKVMSLKKQARDEKTMRAELDQSARTLADGQAQLSHLEQGVPEAAYVPTMLAELEKTGNQCGMKVTGVRPLPKPTVVKKSGDDKGGQQEKTERKPYDEQNIEVKGLGNYESVMKFIQALGTFPKIVATRTITMTPKVDSSKDAPKDMLDVTIELKTFMFKVADDKNSSGAKQSGQ